MTQNTKQTTETIQSIEGNESAPAASQESAPYGYKADGTPRKQRGRPTKKEVTAKKVGGRGKVGRPKGDSAAIKEMKARLLASPKSRKVLDSILNAALDDEHKNQAAAWKLLMDRMLPTSIFDETKNSGSKPAVNITISGIGGETIEIGGNDNSPDEDIDDAEFYEVKDV